MILFILRKYNKLCSQNIVYFTTAVLYILDVLCKLGKFHEESEFLNGTLERHKII